jgi:hypothetical protein
MSMNGKQVMDPMEVAGGMDLSDTEEVQVVMEERRLEKVRKYFRSEAAKKEKEKEKVKKVRKTGMKAKKDDPPSWKGKDWIAFFGKQYVKTGKRTLKEVMEDKHLTMVEREKEVRSLKLDEKAVTWNITDGAGKVMTLEELAETDASTVIWGYLNSGGKAAMTMGNVTIRNAKLEMMKTTAKVETEDHWMKFLNHKEEVASDEEHEALLGNAGPPMRPRDWWDDDYNTNIHLDFEVEIYDQSDFDPLWWDPYEVSEMDRKRQEEEDEYHKDIAYGVYRMNLKDPEEEEKKKVTPTKLYYGGKVKANRGGWAQSERDSMDAIADADQWEEWPDWKVGTIGTIGKYEMMHRSSGTGSAGSSPDRLMIEDQGECWLSEEPED